MSQPPKATAKRLTEAEIATILHSEESFATYLATLTPDQVREYESILEGLPMEALQKKALKAVLRLAEQEAEKNQDERMRMTQKEERVLLSLELLKQLRELEQIQHSLANDE